MSADGTLRRRAKVAALVAKRKGEEPAGGPGLLLRGFLWLEPRTALCLLCVAACAVLTGLMFQQTASFANDVKHLQLLQMKDAELITLKERLRLVSEKLGTSEDHRQEARVSATLVNHLEQQVSHVHNIHDIQDLQKVLQQLQSLQEKLHNATDMYRLYQHEVDLSLFNLKLEVKNIHNQLSSSINTAEQGVKSLAERVEELEDGTHRNIQTIKRQEEDELFQVEKQLAQSNKAAETLEEDWNALLAKDMDLNQKLSEYQPKLSECQSHLAAVEHAVVRVLRVSNELTSMKERTEDMANQIFNMEKRMLKVLSELLNMQRALERF